MLPGPNGNARRPGGFVKLALLIVLVLLAGSACKSSGPAGNKPGAFKTSVTAAKAQVQDVTLSLSGLGSVTPENVVSVRSRVDGELMAVKYQEGQIVHQGDLLAVIDERPFKAQLEQFEGQLARDAAQLANARLDLNRYQGLVKTGTIAKQQFDTQVALVRQLEGTVKSDQGQVDNAKLQVAFCRVTSPLAGRVGLRPVDPGNMIQASNQILATITQLQPITVIFSLPEDQLQRVLDRMRSGNPLTVEAYDRAQQTKLATGTLLTMDNQIDQTTGTVRLKAQFDNSDYRLFPNQFVNANVLVDTLKNALTVPTAAVQQGAGNAVLVYVVKPDSTVEMRTVETGERTGGITVIRKGLAEGESVVIEGGEKLRDGAPVSVKGEGGQPEDSGKDVGAPAQVPSEKPGKDADTPHKKGAAAHQGGE